MTRRSWDSRRTFELASFVFGLAGMALAALAFVALELRWISPRAYLWIASSALVPVGVCWALAVWRSTRVGLSGRAARFRIDTTGCSSFALF